MEQNYKPNAHPYPPHLFLRSALIALLLLLANRVSSQTTLLWSESAGTSSSQQKSFVAVDLIGNIYMASSVNGTYGLDWKVTSWRPDSVLRWSFTHNGTGNLDDVPAAIVVDSAFNVYISGTSSSSGSNDIKMIKLDSAGNVKWNTTYNRTGSAQDVGTGMVVVGNRIFLSGYSQQTTSNYDYTVLKYDTTGLLLWSRHVNGSGSGDDYTSSIAAKSNGDVYVTGNAVITGGTRDIMTLRYTTDGTLQWTKYYGLTTGKNDFGNALGIDAAGNLIVVGQSFVNNNNSDLVSVKYNGTTGAQTWAAKYSGTYGGHDIGNALVIDPDNYFYVTGSTERASNNTDYVTIKYRGNGAVTWVQTYNGPGNAADDSRAIIHDGDDVVITGKSGGSGTGADVTTMSYNKGTGVLNWTMRINESGSTSDEGSALCRDEMGNVCVVGLIVNGSSAFASTLYKLNQNAKNEQAIKTHLEMIAFGINGIVNDTASKRILYDMVNLCVDSFYQVGLFRFLTECDAQSISSRMLMRLALASKYGLSSSYNWEKIIDSRIFEMNSRRRAMIFVPGFETFDRNEFIANNAHSAFSYGETDFPISGIPEYEDLYEINFLESPRFTAIIRPTLWWNKNSPFFRLCYASVSFPNSSQCSVCGGFDPVDGLTSGSNCSSSLMAHEVGIRIGYEYNGFCNIPQAGTEICLQVFDLSLNPNNAYPQFAILSGIPGYCYYERIGQNAYQCIRKVQYPIYEVATGQFATGMTLCENDEFEYNDYHGAIGYTHPYALAWGGVYKIYKPGTNQRPVYFAFPSTKYVRYDGGPDVNIIYGSHDASATCADGRMEIEEDYFIGGCEICDVTQTVFNFTQNQMADILVTTDYSTISSYWLDNVITVGFNDDGTPVHPANHKTFTAVNNPTPCSPSSYNPVSMTPICQQQLLSDGKYEIREDFSSNSYYPPGTNLLIHVQARFANGESINECQTITLAAGTNDMTNVCVEIRGGINDYSSIYTNYQVDTYLMP